MRVNYIDPYVNAGGDQDLCESVTYLAANNPASQGGTGHWETITGSVSYADINNNATYIYNIQQGINTLRWIVDIGECSKSDDVLITNNTL